MSYYVIQDPDNPRRRAMRRTAKAAFNIVRTHLRRGAKNLVIRTGEGRYLKPHELAALVPQRTGRGPKPSRLRVP